MKTLTLENVKTITGGVTSGGCILKTGEKWPGHNQLMP